MKLNDGPAWVDISLPLENDMANWPGNPPFSVRRVKSIEQGDRVNLSEISMGTHSGTHVDAPVHYIRGGVPIDMVSLDILIGRARVIGIEDTESIKPEELLGHRIQRGERILFKTANSLYAGKNRGFTEDFVYISDDAADFLVDCAVCLVGVDYLSLGSFRNGGQHVHQTLLRAGVCIVEGLDLSRVCPGTYDLVCLPLRLSRGDGGPARAVLRYVSGVEPRNIVVENGG
jgi:arylformamidase